MERKLLNLAYRPEPLTQEQLKALEQAAWAEAWAEAERGFKDNRDCPWVHLEPIAIDVYEDGQWTYTGSGCYGEGKSQSRTVEYRISWLSEEDHDNNKSWWTYIDMRR